jgi:putative NADH-flavin reductase
MQILILGASGLTGQHLVQQALEKSHEVTVLVRDASKLNITHEHLTVITGDVLDETTLNKALQGKDVVMSALGRGKSLKSHELMTNTVTRLLPAMNNKQVNRLIFLSAFGVGETYKQANFIQKFFFSTFLKNLFADKARADAMIRESSLDWTLVYPVVLTNGPALGTYKVGDTLPMKGMPKISRADVAEFMMRQLTDNTYQKRTAVLMS